MKTRKVKIWVVLYCDYPTMRERWYRDEHKEEAEKFTKEVNGSLCDFMVLPSVANNIQTPQP